MEFGIMGPATPIVSQKLALITMLEHKLPVMKRGLQTAQQEYEKYLAAGNKKMIAKYEKIIANKKAVIDAMRDTIATQKKVIGR